ncbi:MAG: prepilin-type N-terminal cleavage/methylation domain-containing protein [Proteobacteria bacterium]|nr:prepilin-type N-terminal cleavage/methylation domain-containing protein [Pseudomonadota bacterium]
MRDSGFTLIEMMVVVAIIAILATVAVPAYRGYITEAARAEAAATLADISAKEEAYRGSWGNYVLTSDGYPTILNPNDKGIQPVTNNSGWISLGYSWHSDAQGGLFGGPVYYRYRVISTNINEPGRINFGANYTVCAHRNLGSGQFETVRLSNFNRRSLITSEGQACVAMTGN